MFGGKKRRLAAWAQVATELGGKHQLQSRWWRGDEYIEAVIRGVTVKLDVYVVSTGKSTHAYTRIGADVAHGPGPKCKVQKKGFWQTIGKALGMEDIAIGDATFDETFVVKSDSVSIARRLWSPEAMTRMAAFTDTWVATTPERVEMIGGGRWDDPKKMRAAMELVAELAARDLYGVAALQAMGASLSQPPGERPRVELDTGARVVVMAEDRDDRLVMSARVYDRLPHEPIVVEVEDGMSELATKLPQGAQVHLAKVGSGRLSIGETSAFLWNDLELDPDRLRAGADLLGAFGVREGVYR